MSALLTQGLTTKIYAPQRYTGEVHSTQTHTDTGAIQPTPSVRTTAGFPGVSALKGCEDQSTVQAQSTLTSNNQLYTSTSPIQRLSPSTELTAGHAHGEEAGRSHLWSARLHLGGVASCSWPTRDRAHHVCRTLSGPQAVCPTRTSSGCEDEPRRLMRRQDWAPSALVQILPGLPHFGPSFSSTQ